jgi:hypothetical protein
VRRSGSDLGRGRTRDVDESLDDLVDVAGERPTGGEQVRGRVRQLGVTRVEK